MYSTSKSTELVVVRTSTVQVRVLVLKVRYIRVSTVRVDYTVEITKPYLFVEFYWQTRKLERNILNVK